MSSNDKLRNASDAIEARLDQRRAELERDIPGITAFIGDLKAHGFTVEGVRRKLDGHICPPSPPSDRFVKRRKRED